MLLSSRPPSAYYGNSSKFKATLLWNNLVDHLRRNVKQKRRRLLLRGVGPTECFSGSDVCDTVLLYLLVDNDNFKTSDLTREKARKLCQLLLDSKLFEPLSGIGEKQKFEDNSHRYYKFIGSCSSLNRDDERLENVEPLLLPSRCHSAPDFLPNSDETRTRRSAQPDLLDGLISKPSADTLNTEFSPLNCSGYVIQELLNMTTICRQESNRAALTNIGINKQCCDEAARTTSSAADPPSRGSSVDCESVGMQLRWESAALQVGVSGTYRLKRSSLGSSPKSCSGEKVAKISGEVLCSPADDDFTAIADMRQEIALSQLCQLIDLPLLEGIVCGGQLVKDEPYYDNAVFCSAGADRLRFSNDEWVRSAVQVLDHIPNSHNALLDCSNTLSINDYKLFLYKTILKNYRARVVSLLPSGHEPIHMAVLGLIMCGSEEKAVYAMRLAAILLPPFLMTEVSALLEFLQTVSISQEPRVRLSQNNNDAVLNDYCGIFFMDCKLLSMDQRRILLLLMMRYHNQLSQEPHSVQVMLEKNMQRLRKGDDTPSPSFLFCTKVTEPQYEQMRAEFTERAIVSLIRGVIDDTKMALKEKQRHLKQFHKHHPAIMLKHFNDLA